MRRGGLTALALLAVACGKVSVATDSVAPPTPATVVEAGATREATPVLGKDRSEPAATNETTIRLERTTCYGVCPAYTVEIRSDGSVHYEGKKFVAVKAPADSRVAPAAVRALAARFEQISFFRLDWKVPCDLLSTDHPTAMLTFTTGGRTRTIKDYHGDGCVPLELRKLEDEVDRVAGTDAWVPCKAEPDGYCNR